MLVLKDEPGWLQAWEAGRVAFDGPGALFHSWPDPVTKCSRCGVRYSPDAARCTAATWLEELTARFGISRVSTEPAPLERHGSPCLRSLWLWFVGGYNHLLTVDRFARWWEISAEANAMPGVQYVTAKCKADTRPDDVIRRVLVAAGWLE